MQSSLPWEFQSVLKTTIMMYVIQDALSHIKRKCQSYECPECMEVDCLNYTFRASDSEDSDNDKQKKYVMIMMDLIIQMRAIMLPSMRC